MRFPDCVVRGIAWRASTYAFSGLCSDCTGLQSGTSVVTGTLVLVNDALGQALDASNFVSFAYDGSNKAGPLTITNPTAFSATLTDMMSQFVAVRVRTDAWDFATDLGGNLNLADVSGFGTGPGAGAPLDVGTAATWTELPEPATLPLLAGALLASAGLASAGLASAGLAVAGLASAGLASAGLAVAGLAVAGRPRRRDGLP